ncbi:SH3 domain-containing protein [Lysobacter sp. 13A]|uniref:SH3 domain-containing protein n=2 Tax=Novilysobacter selenitireducens TaxID=2872639 RepID=A0ABS7T4H1_9GAMM|nr:SH3 domain-containing protein [Lysobacter selenitireducens]MBZ4038753.1 SH3 domain-containing protein [Lysobacter selenitireducens]
MRAMLGRMPDAVIVRRRPPSIAGRTSAFILLALLACLGATARTPESVAPDIVGMDDPARWTPAYWIERAEAPDRPLAPASAIQAQNARLVRDDPSMYDLAALGPVVERDQVLGWIQGLSRRPSAPRHDAKGARLPAAALDELEDALALDAVPARQATRYGLVVRRAPLRTFPTDRRVFSTPGDTDIDRFQESALFPGTPVAIAHASRDGEWLFVVSQRYAAWIEARHVAEGDAATVLGYAERTPYRLVTGAAAHTVHTPEAPAVSDVQLDMGTRLPSASSTGRVNGQHPASGHAVELPVRQDDGRLLLRPALLPRSADTADAPLPLTRRHLIGQAFKFLGERYGWGHDYNARDCSGFVSEVYASLGLVLPRNTGDQAGSPVLATTRLDDVASRAAVLEALQVGDLVYVPGHVMMVIGHADGEPFVIHDIHGGGQRGADGEVVRLGLNGVVVTSLRGLVFDDGTPYVERATAVVRPAPTS